jgi:hypothetical protein
MVDVGLYSKFNDMCSYERFCKHVSDELDYDDKTLSTFNIRQIVLTGQSQKLVIICTNESYYDKTKAYVKSCFKVDSIRIGNEITVDAVCQGEGSVSFAYNKLCNHIRNAGDLACYETITQVPLQQIGGYCYRSFACGIAKSSQYIELLQSNTIDISVVSNNTALINHTSATSISKNNDITAPIISNRPIIPQYNVDINDYIGYPCIYLIYLRDCDFKFGYSIEVDDRYNTHVKYFKNHKCEPQIVKLWKCETPRIMKDVESKIKTMAEHRGIRVSRYKQTEIISTDDITRVITEIDKYVNELNASSTKITDLRRLELENENLRLRIQLHELEKKTLT